MFSIPELAPNCPSLRISPEVDVPVTPRIKRLIDHKAFRRLSHISQLGFVSFVYPGATHTRFEHSLGVYRNAVHFLLHLQHDPVFIRHMDERTAVSFLLAALLHDIGHWPYCHTIEDLKLENVPRHENIAKRLLMEESFALLLERDWEIQPQDIAAILSPGLLSPDLNPSETSGCTNSTNATDEFLVTPTSRPAMQIVRSMLSGPVDIDKLDYLERDSLHAGVPYGRNFDRSRLIKSLCVNPETLELAISNKGKTAAEMMVFARYIMFSEVYWHHAVRSGTAMLQRGLHELFAGDEKHAADSGIRHVPAEFVHRWIHQTDVQVSDELLRLASGQSWEPCFTGVLGNTRDLYKRVAQFDFLDEPELHRRLSRRPYTETVLLSDVLAERLKSQTGWKFESTDLLLDAPPAKLDVQFKMDVKVNESTYRPLGDVSPMVRALATEQFDDFVKRVRIFAKPELAARIQSASLDLKEMVAHAADQALSE